MPRAFLEVDPSIVEKNLKITNEEEDDFNNFMQESLEGQQSTVVKPAPGFCIKTKEIGADTKLFVNVCKTDVLPSPRDITEDELAKIIESEDETADFRVPMSIGEIKLEKDKKGEDVKVCDVAISERFFDKIEKYQSFKEFFVAIVFEGINNKYSITASDDKIILRNRKVYGTLQPHRIVRRDVEDKMRQGRRAGLMEEITGGASATGKRPFIEVLQEERSPYVKPQFRLYQVEEDGKALFADVKLPNVMSLKELTLDVGEDRIIVESAARKYLLDVYMPFFVETDDVISGFNNETKILTIKMSIKQDNIKST